MSCKRSPSWSPVVLLALGLLSGCLSEQSSEEPRDERGGEGEGEGEGYEGEGEGEGAEGEGEEGEGEGEEGEGEERRDGPCEGLGEEACEARPDCQLLWPLGPQPDPGECPWEDCGPAPACVPVELPRECEDRSIERCAEDGLCFVQEYPDCEQPSGSGSGSAGVPEEAQSDGPSPAPPCEMREYCVPHSPLPADCHARGVQDCELDGSCRINPNPWMLETVCLPLELPQECHERSEEQCAEDGLCYWDLPRGPETVEPSCSPRALPEVCEARTEDECPTDLRCRLEVVERCPEADQSDEPGHTRPECVVETVCRAVQLPDACEDRDPERCLLDERCMLEVEELCERGDGGEEDHCWSVQVCVTPGCEQRSVDECEADERCELVRLEELDECGEGVPCPMIDHEPVPVCRERQPLPCEGLDEQDCLDDPECEPFFGPPPCPEDDPTCVHPDVELYQGCRLFPPDPDPLGCELDEDCGPEASCVGGHCVSDRSCDDDLGPACEEGQWCSGGRCIERLPCGGGGGCPEGWICNDCPPDPDCWNCAVCGPVPLCVLDRGDEDS